MDTKTWAVFGDFTYDFTPQWSVSLGGRYTKDERRANVFRQKLILAARPCSAARRLRRRRTARAGTSNFHGSRDRRGVHPARLDQLQADTRTTTSI